MPTKDTGRATDAEKVATRRGVLLLALVIVLLIGGGILLGKIL